MRLLLLIFLAVCSAQKPSIDDTTNWINSFLLHMNPTTTKPKFHIFENKQSRPSTSCTTPEGQEGMCVQPQFCTVPLEEHDTTTDFVFRESGCSSYLLQCCPVDQVRPVPKRTNILPQGCGWSNPGGYGVRTNDLDPTGFSDFAEFPWMVALLKRSFGKQWDPENYIGGGTLIHPSVVLTVAHKVDLQEATQLKCRAGEWDFKVEDEIYIHQDRNVRKIAIHKDFLRSRAHYNAALLFLETPFELGNEYHIGIACLARDMPAPGTLCYSMGWGRTINGSEKTSLLKKIQLPMVDSETCQRQLGHSILGPKFTLHQSLCCAGGELGQDTCIGDGGSSLVCPLTSENSMKRYLVHGMVAYGVHEDCGKLDFPGVYAKVPSVLDWIDRVMQREQYNTKTYYMS